MAAIAALLPTVTTFHFPAYEVDPRPAHGLDAIVDDLARIVGDEFGQAKLAGISFGGFVAHRLATSYPALVDRLVLLVAVHRFSAEGQGRIPAQIASWDAGDFDGLVRDNALLFRRPWYNSLARLRYRRRKGPFAAEFNDPAAVARAYRPSSRPTSSGTARTPPGSAPRR